MHTNAFRDELQNSQALFNAKVYSEVNMRLLPSGRSPFAAALKKKHS